MSTEAEQAVDQAQKLVHRISRILHGNDREVQEIVLVQLVGLYLSGYPKQYRDKTLDRMTQAMLDLSAINELTHFGKKGHPGNE